VVVSRNLKKRLWAFDFDGVACDSTEECLVTAWNAWGRGPFIRRPAEAPAAFARFFRPRRVFVRGAGEYYVVCRAFEEGRPFKRQADFERLCKAWAAFQPAFAEKFFAARRRLRRVDLDAWIGLHGVHARVLKAMARLNREGRLCVVTLKDARSVELILGRRGLKLPRRRILDQARIKSKMDGLRRAARDAGTTPQETMFLDDNVTHLLEPRREGVPCFLASWGYVTPEHRAAARRAGIPSATPAGLEKLTSR
jgi:phosphoglycolate phosphatase-like HAD superfamily hydrolase